MPRPVKVLGGLCGVGQGSASEGAIVGRNSGGGVVSIVDGDRVSSLHQFLVVGDHQGQLELL